MVANTQGPWVTEWLRTKNLFLFDFDGLLVNTEQFHFLAYKQVLAEYGFHLDWDFDTYIQIAHYTASGLSESIYSKFPLLKEKEPNWDLIYKRKKERIEKLAREEEIGLMPGVAHFLHVLEKNKKKMVVVTHSPKDLIEAIKNKNPTLKKIEHWITRENYNHPKPNSECYLKAISLFAEEKEEVIGFEDTPRGLTALLGTRAQPVLVSTLTYPEVPAFKEQGVLVFSSFEEI